MKHIKFIFILLILLAMAPVLSASAGFVPYESYNYNSWGESVSMPLTYTISKAVSGGQIGSGALSTPTDMYRLGDELYILDAGNKRIVVTDLALNLKRTLDNPELLGATGIYVQADNTILIAARDSERILTLDPDGKLLHSFGKPVGEEIPANLTFKPLKVIAGSNDSLFIVCEGSFQGLIETDRQGNSRGFYGGNRVDVTAQVLADMFWKRLFSREQREGMNNTVPIEYSSADIDAKGFVYAVTAQSQNSMYEIKKLDPKGNNILRVRSSYDMAPGVELNIGNYGDIETGYERGQTTDTRFIDIKADDSGFLYALDGQRGRVFQYDNESNLLCVFGGMGAQTGSFKNPVSIEYANNCVYVLDSELSEITVFEPTPFGASIMEAVTLYNKGRYAESKQLWLTVNAHSPNFELANTGIGKSLYMEGDFTGAMKYYRLANDRRGFDDAFSEYRKAIVRENFVLLVVLLAIAIAVAVLMVRFVKRRHPIARLIGSKTYLPVGYYLSKPFKASDDVRMYDRGTVRSAVVIMSLLLISRIVSMCMSGFLFSTHRIEDIKVLNEIVLVFALYSGFLLCNWAVSTLMDGEGRWRDVAIVTGYSFFPMMAGNLITTILSTVLTLREGTILGLISSVSVVFSVILLFIGIMTVHRLTAAKAAANIALTLIGMLIIFFLLFLVYGLFSQLVTFMGNIFTEFLFRI